VRDKDRIAGEQKSIFLGAKIDIVNGLVRAHSLLGPRYARVIGPAEEAVIAANPAAFAVKEVDGVEIFALGTEARWYPPFLSKTYERICQEQGEEAQQQYEPVLQRFHFFPVAVNWGVVHSDKSGVAAWVSALTLI
jgi:hypothetical protein